MLTRCIQALGVLITLCVFVGALPLAACGRGGLGSAWPSQASREIDKLKAEAVQAGAAEWLPNPETGAVEFVWIDGKSFREASKEKS